MFSILFTIWLLYAAILLSPGANTILITQLAASEHDRSARVAALGVAVGSTMWCICAVFGIHVIFVIFPAMRMTLQVAGGIYLLYLASRLWRTSSGTDSAKALRASKSSLAAFRMGLLTNMTNPKAALFFGSVFAASFPASPGKALQAAVIVMVMLTSAGYHLLLAYVFSRHSVRAGYARSRGAFNRVAAVGVSSLGLGLLVATFKEAKRQLLVSST
ncbi:LysE family translocator [Geomonas sp.]|uniref:LysE family translocator n=1 Tax=Geomonas sp. TaxID=2651584 RepID=UPI002B49C476|nr:LysE family transporter [Geomonas sp.]HJV36244.1 LysE family transporter [Geomonas sp.]